MKAADTRPTKTAVGVGKTAPVLERRSRDAELRTQNDCFAPPIVAQVLRSPGQPLDPATRAFMEPRFGEDFSQVRVHTDARAAASANAVSALAYTVGRNIVFGEESFKPMTSEGQRLIAHELTHAAQQAGATGTVPDLLQANSPGEATEEEAARSASAILAGKPARISLQSPTRLQRQHTEDPIHRGMVEQYRREHGEPESGVNESGERVGPSEAAIKYELIPAERLRANYDQALIAVRGLDPGVYQYLSRARLNGGNQLILSGQSTDTSVTPPVTVQFNLNLVVRTASLAPGQNALFREGVPTLSPVGTTRLLTANMSMEISNEAAFDPPALARSLYHEGLHLLLFVQNLVSPSAPSPHVAALANYNRIARANPNSATVLAELEAYIDQDWRRRAIDPMPDPRRAARETMSHMIEEKYVFDQERVHFGTQPANASLARGYILDGFREMGVRADLSNQNVIRIIRRFTQILDDIDGQIRPRINPGTGAQPPGTTPPPQGRPRTP